MAARDKISSEFRQRLDELGEDDSLCALVTLTPPEVSTTGRQKRKLRKQILAEVDVYTTNTLDELRSLIEKSGGEILSVSRPLSIVTIQAGRSLIEELAKDDSVTAIIENQPIKGFARR